MSKNASTNRSGARLEARALWFPEAGRCALLSEDLAGPGADEALVETLFSGISRGTENLVFSGKVPDSERQRMRGPNMAGDFSFPVKYGYAAVGRVREGPEELIGRHVFCLHPHQDWFVAPAAMLSPLPSGLPPARAVLAANMETALNIVWDAGIQPGDTVAVFGAGTVGALVAFLAASIPATETTLIDPNAKRATLGERLGLSFSASRYEGPFDVAINVSGSDKALATAIEAAGKQARIVEASWHGSGKASIPLGGAFHAQRLEIVSSQVGSLPANHRARWTFARRMGKALQLLADDRLDALISGDTSFEEIEAAYPGILSSPDTLCHRIRY
ncbi:zinc-dependent alcohol dehydrogenase [Martelella radicis]|uniref:NADPH:quinone reductase-like Zn-dependent oxidoreductase n=1 Tax=Martelella radicis TaxID=1397476 RepID=A0A7W6PBS9_9HYPH|nr:zinc-binding alcohol dehydrogenase [Martelella radicis]MBB4122727.1 NADPH:quinone reductase-like Zn-dependent oxidoreductase [Martelella radicis]